MDKPTTSDYETLVETVKALDQRVSTLEQLAGVKSTAPVSEPAAPPVTAPVAPPVTAPVTPPAEPIAPPAVETGAYAQSAFEIKFGTKGALYCGLLLLLIGVSSLVAWSYQYMGPAFKIGSGLVVALAMVGGGEFIASRRSSMKWYGMGLTGGGYALGYFVLYAMQNIASVKIPDNAVVDSCLLLSWASLCLGHSLWRKSEEIALLSTLLSFVTISLAPLGFFAVAASAILAVALGWVVVRMDWLKVYLCGAVGSYLTYVLFTQPQIQSAANGPDYTFWLPGAFLAVFWLVYNTVAFLLKPAPDDQVRRYTILSVLALNAVGFVVPALHSTGQLYPEWRWLFLAVTGAAYFAMTGFAASRGLNEVRSLALLLGLQLVTAAVPLKLDGQFVSAVWFLEVAFLVVSGLRFNQLPFRWFAAALAAVTAGRLLLVDLSELRTIVLAGQSIDWRWLAGVVAIASYAAAAWSYRRECYSANLREYEKRLAYPLFLLLAAGCAWAVPAFVAAETARTVLWSVEGLALIALGLRTRGKLAQDLAALSLLTSAVSLAVNYQGISLVPTCLVVSLFYLTSFAHKWAPANDQLEGRTRHHAYVLASVLLTLLMTGLRYNANPLSLALSWSLEAGLIILLGFQLKDSTVRRLGMCGFALPAYILSAAWPAWTWAGVLPIAGILFALHCRYRLGCPQEPDSPRTFLDGCASLGKDENEYVKHILLLGGMILLWALFGTILKPEQVALVWTCLFAVTVWTGFLLRERYLRLLGSLGFVPTALALAATTNSWTWASVLPVVALVCALHVRYRRNCPPDADEPTGLDKWLDSILTDGEPRLFRNAYMLYGSVLLFAACGLLLASKWLALAWALQSMAAIAGGFVLRDVSYRKLGTAGMAAVIFALVSTRALWMWSTIVPIMGMLLVLYFTYRQLLRAKQLGESNAVSRILPGVSETLSTEVSSIRDGYALAATVLCTVAFAQLLDPQVLALGWSLEGLALMAMGLTLRERIFRLGGWVVLSLLTLKLLLIDLSDAETIQRIISFIVAGFVWLVVSFTYGWLNKRLAGDDSHKDSASA